MYERLKWRQLVVLSLCWYTVGIMPAVHRHKSRGQVVIWVRSVKLFMVHILRWHVSKVPGHPIESSQITKLSRDIISVCSTRKSPLSCPALLLRIMWDETTKKLFANVICIGVYYYLVDIWANNCKDQSQRTLVSNLKLPVNERPRRNAICFD